MRRSRPLDWVVFIVIPMVAGALFWECSFCEQPAYSQPLPQPPTSPTAGPTVQPLFTDLSDDEIRARGFRRDSPVARPGERARIAQLDWNVVSNALHNITRVCLPVSSLSDCREFFPLSSSSYVPPFRGPTGTIPRLSWVGRLNGDASSEAVFIIRDGDQAISGTVRYQGRIYEVNPVGRAVISIVEVNPSLYVPDKSPNRYGGSPSPNPVHPQTGKPMLPTPVPLQIQTGQKTKIDVMVVYTSAARIKVEASCSGCLIQDKITEALVQANISLGTNSQQEFRLVYVIEENYSQNSVNTDMSYLQGNADGFLDQVHQWRCAFTADVVSLWVEYDPPEPCGVAYGPMKWLGPGSWGYNYPDPENWAFSVVRRNCAVNFLTFHHELGHVMGADHDRQDVLMRMPPGSLLTGYGYGYIDWTHWKATIMARPPSAGWLENLWSSPSQQFSTGSPAGTSVDDNRRVLNETATKVSSFSDRACPDTTSPDITPPDAPQNLRIR